MRNQLTVSLAVMLAILLAVNCGLTILGFIPSRVNWLLAVLPGITGTILCAAIGAILIHMKLAPLDKIHDFLESQGQIPLHPHECGELGLLAKAAVDRDKAAKENEMWYEDILNFLPLEVNTRIINYMPSGRRISLSVKKPIEEIDVEPGHEAGINAILGGSENVQNGKAE